MSYPNLDDLQLVNTDVNQLPYLPDVGDEWKPLEPSGGDCEDFSLMKLKLLYARGWPVAFLRLATCWVEPEIPPPNNYHCVLAVDCPDGNQRILDNRFGQVQTLDELERFGYMPDKIQAVGGEKEWCGWIWE